MTSEPTAPPPSSAPAPTVPSSAAATGVTAPSQPAPPAAKISGAEGSSSKHRHTRSRSVNLSPLIGGPGWDLATAAAVAAAAAAASAPSPTLAPGASASPSASPRPTSPNLGAAPTATSSHHYHDTVGNGRASPTVNGWTGTPSSPVGGVRRPASRGGEISRHALLSIHEGMLTRSASSSGNSSITGSSSSSSSSSMSSSGGIGGSGSHTLGGQGSSAFGPPALAGLGGEGMPSPSPLEADESFAGGACSPETRRANLHRPHHRDGGRGSSGARSRTSSPARAFAMPLSPRLQAMVSSSSSKHQRSLSNERLLPPRALSPVLPAPTTGGMSPRSTGAAGAVAGLLTESGPDPKHPFDTVWPSMGSPESAALPHPLETQPNHLADTSAVPPTLLPQLGHNTATAKSQPARRRSSESALERRDLRASSSSPSLRGVPSPTSPTTATSSSEPTTRAALRRQRTSSGPCAVSVESTSPATNPSPPSAGARPSAGSSAAAAQGGPLLAAPRPERAGPRTEAASLRGGWRASSPSPAGTGAAATGTRGPGGGGFGVGSGGSGSGGGNKANPTLRMFAPSGTPQVGVDTQHALAEVSLGGGSGSPAALASNSVAAAAAAAAATFSEWSALVSEPAVGNGGGNDGGGAGARGSHNAAGATSSESPSSSPTHQGFPARQPSPLGFGMGGTGGIGGGGAGLSNGIARTRSPFSGRSRTPPVVGSELPGWALPAPHLQQAQQQPQQAESPPKVRSFIGMPPRSGYELSDDPDDVGSEDGSSTNGSDRASSHEDEDRDVEGGGAAATGGGDEMERHTSSGKARWLRRHQRPPREDGEKDDDEEEDEEEEGEQRGGEDDEEGVLQDGDAVDDDVADGDHRRGHGSKQSKKRMTRMMALHALRSSSRERMSVLARRSSGGDDGGGGGGGGGSSAIEKSGESATMSMEADEDAAEHAGQRVRREGLGLYRSGASDDSDEADEEEDPQGEQQQDLEAGGNERGVGAESGWGTTSEGEHAQEPVEIEEGLSVLERIFLFAKSELTYHRVLVARSLPDWILEVELVDAVEYVIPLLNGLGTDELDVCAAFVPGLHRIMWYFFRNCPVLEYGAAPDPKERGSGDGDDGAEAGKEQSGSSSEEGPGGSAAATRADGDDDEERATRPRLAVNVFTPLLCALLLNQNANVANAAQYGIVCLLARLRRLGVQAEPPLLLLESAAQAGGTSAGTGAGPSTAAAPAEGEGAGASLAKWDDDGVLVHDAAAREGRRVPLESYGFGGRQRGLVVEELLDHVVFAVGRLQDVSRPPEDLEHSAHPEAEETTADHSSAGAERADLSQPASQAQGGIRGPSGESEGQEGRERSDSEAVGSSSEPEPENPVEDGGAGGAPEPEQAEDSEMAVGASGPDVDPTEAVAAETSEAKPGEDAPSSEPPDSVMSDTGDAADPVDVEAQADGQTGVTGGEGDGAEPDHFPHPGSAMSSSHAFDASDFDEEAAVGRMACVSLLSALGAEGIFHDDELHARVLPEVTRLQTDRAFYVRKEVALALGSLAKHLLEADVEEKLLPMFDALLSDRIWHVRQALCLTIPNLLGRLGQEARRSRVVASMRAFVHDEDANVRSAALEIIGEVIYLFHGSEGGVPQELVRHFLGEPFDVTPPDERADAKAGERRQGESSQNQADAEAGVDSEQPDDLGDRMDIVHEEGILAAYAADQAHKDVLSHDAGGGKRSGWSDDVYPYQDSERNAVMAYNFPAVVLTLGSAAWPRLRYAHRQLFQDEYTPKVRRSLAASLHAIAGIIGAHATQADLLELFEALIQDPSSEVEVKEVAMEHFAELLACVEARVAESQLARIKAQWHASLAASWRLREVLVKQVPAMAHPYLLSDEGGSLVSLVQLAMDDPVSAVREAGVQAVPTLYDILSEQEQALADGFLGMLVDMSESAHYRQRVACLRAFRLVFGSHIQRASVEMMLLERFIALGADEVVDVRIALARAVQLMCSLDELYASPQSRSPRLLELLAKLAKDRFAEVRDPVVMILPADDPLRHEAAELAKHRAPHPPARRDLVLGPSDGGPHRPPRPPGSPTMDFSAPFEMDEDEQQHVVQLPDPSHLDGDTSMFDDADDDEGGAGGGRSMYSRLPRGYTLVRRESNEDDEFGGGSSGGGKEEDDDERDEPHHLQRIGSEERDVDADTDGKATAGAMDLDSIAAPTMTPSSSNDGISRRAILVSPERLRSDGAEDAADLPEAATHTETANGIAAASSAGAGVPATADPFLAFVSDKRYRDGELAELELPAAASTEPGGQGVTSEKSDSAAKDDAATSDAGTTDAEAADVEGDAVAHGRQQEAAYNGGATEGSATQEDRGEGGGHDEGEGEGGGEGEGEQNVSTELDRDVETASEAAPTIEPATPDTQEKTAAPSEESGAP